MGRHWVQQRYNQFKGVISGVAAWANRCLRVCVLRRQLSKQKIGQLGENLVARFLMRRGFLIIGRRTNRFGAEMDLVGVDFQGVSPQLVAVEVKTRRRLPDQHTAVYPLVSHRQLTRLKKALERLATLYDITPEQTRVDTVLVHWPLQAILPTVYRMRT